METNEASVEGRLLKLKVAVWSDQWCATEAGLAYPSSVVIHKFDVPATCIA
jgi:hypothetical protein